MFHPVKIFAGILILKVIFILLFMALHFGIISFGEKKGHAEEPEKQGFSSEIPGSGEAHQLADAKGQTSSFLESLLTLPPLDIEKSSKDEVGRYLTMIEQAKQQVEDRIKSLGTKHSRLKSLERKIDEKLQLLDKERKFFSNTIQQEKKIQKERLDTLVDLYVKMEPKKAAPVFEEMDKDLAIALFKKMKKKQVTRILELMDTKKSVEITEYFGRVGSAREYDLLKEMNKSLQLAFNDCKEPALR